MVELSLADLIDLELELQRDRSRPIEVLHERDERIARELDAGVLEDRALSLAWLRGLGLEVPTAGTRVASFLELLGVILFGIGLLSGAGAVAGWLEMGDGRPVNVVNFWAVLVGSQLLLLIGWLLSTQREVLRGLGGLMPSAVGFAISRLSARVGSAVGETLGELRKVDWLYRRLRFWRTTALSQTFAVAFNLGALGALVAIPYVDDPAFGWRSRLLDVHRLHDIARAAALPWSWASQEGVPSLDEVALTQYSSVDPRFDPSSVDPRFDPSGGQPGTPSDASSSEGAEVWAAWWPFLVASLACYGLLPRLVLWGLAAYRGRRELTRAALDHTDHQRLRERLRRPAVDTRSPTADRDGAPEASVPPGSRSHSVRLDGERALVLRWEGVDLVDDRVRSLLSEELGAEVADIQSVGGLAPEQDGAALDALGNAGAGTVVLLVQAWEPPVADYVDFVEHARKTLGDGATLLVLLHETDPEGRPAPAEERHLRMWRRQLAGLGDPWLRVEPLVSGEPS